MKERTLISRLLVGVAMPLVVGLVAVACGREPVVAPTAGTPSPTGADGGRSGVTATPTAGTQSLIRADGGQGGVIVEATWVTDDHLRTLSQGQLGGYTLDKAALVHVKVDTHSVDISGYDLASLARLRGRDGTDVLAAAWLKISESDHHREGILVFPVGDAASWAQREGRATLSVTGVAGVPERSLEWEF